MTALTLTNVSKSFGKVDVLKDINLTVEEGEFVVFVGPSGCGKSTLLRTIAGLEDVTSGEIRIGGEVVNMTPPAKRGIAMVFQSYALYPHLTVKDNMALALKQASGDNVEAIFLLRAYRTTLPRLAVSEPINTAEMRLERRMRKSYQNVAARQRELKTDMRTTCYAIALERLQDVYRARGIWP